MFLRNCWYVAAWDNEIAKNTLLARKLLGQRVVLYRTSDGGPVALEDRCSHRFAPLSVGRLEKDCVRCMYHGLLFNSQGKCVEEPGRKHVSKNTDITSFPVAEKWHFVWVWLGDPELADETLIPDCTYQDDPNWKYVPRYRHFAADYRLILDNLLDFSHLTFVHEKTLGGSDNIAATKPKVEAQEKRVRITRWYLNEPELAPYLKGHETFTGPVDRWNIYNLDIVGNIFNMDSGSAPADTGAPEGNFAPESMLFHATQVVTPEDENNSHFFWSYAHNFNLKDEVFTQAISDRIAEGFEEDKTMIEAQQTIVRENPDLPMTYIHFDNGLTQGRKILTKALNAEAAYFKTSQTG